MSTLNDYLQQKRDALAGLRDRLRSPDAGPVQLAATVSAEGRSGIRRIRIRDFQVVSDSPPDFAGYDLGPGSPELQLGVLGSCLTHSWLIQAADQGVVLDDLHVEVTADLDPRGSQLGREDIPVYPHNIAFVVHVTSPAGPEAIARIEAAVERYCPILNLLKHPQVVAGRVRHAAG